MNADATGEKRLTRNEAADENPSCSPTGFRIVFESNREGKDQIYLIADDGSAERRLTSNGKHNVFPFWLPDGKTIGFSAQTEEKKTLTTVSADGGTATEINVSGFYFRWSPNGKKIAAIQGQFPSTRIVVMDVDGANARQIAGR
jgi:TolB protein